jgi:hypothetical protein
MKYLPTKISTLLLASVLGLFVYSSASAQATIVIQNNDPAGSGFNDTTPATPVGGNNGTTVGDQRLIAFQAAANIWGATLTSGPTITIRASWAEMRQGCTLNSGVLGSAGNSGLIHSDLPGLVPGFWYGNALANALTGADQNGATQEINAQFNSALGTTGCLQNSHWYYGLDNNHGSTGIDLVNVLLHEFAHGLGFQTFTNRTTGAQIGGLPSIYDRYLFDNQTGKTWPQMTDAERSASAINTGHLTWNGPQVLNDVLSVLSGTSLLRVNTPASIAGNYPIGTADFGPKLTSTGVTAGIVQAVPANACSPLSNSLVGSIALIDRGDCTFVEKTRNAQNAGAVGVIIVDILFSATPPAMGGGPDNTIIIPAVSVTQANGDTIKAQLASGVNATMFVDFTTVAGADSAHRPLMFAPNPLVGGSSVAHWDTSASPNQLMEPNISGDLFHSVTPPQDLTFSLLRDIGWPGTASGLPTILTEQGNPTVAAALDSVTQVRGPFTVLTSNNFSTNGRRRLIFFTTDLGLSAGNTTGLTVQANGIPLIVENAGPFIAIGGTSYIIVSLPDLQPGMYALTVTLNGANSTNAPTIQIVP